MLGTTVILLLQFVTNVPKYRTEYADTVVLPCILM